MDEHGKIDQPPRLIKTTFEDSVKCVAISDDDLYVASGSLDGTLSIWEQNSDTLTEHKLLEWINDVAFQPGVLQIDEGLDPGETIATTGMRQLSDGASVEVRAAS